MPLPVLALLERRKRGSAAQLKTFKWGLALFKRGSKKSTIFDLPHPDFLGGVVHGKKSVSQLLTV